MILEYCALGALKKYMTDHFKEFSENIKPTKQQTDIVDVTEPNKHTIDLLMLWAYQVRPRLYYNNSIKFISYHPILLIILQQSIICHRSQVAWNFLAQETFIMAI